VQLRAPLSDTDIAQVCPSWAPTGALEQHISGDISFAAAQYWWMTGDLQWLAKIGIAVRCCCAHRCSADGTATGYPMMAGVADFWVSRVQPLASNASLYAIDDVIPPDEYAVNVSNRCAWPAVWPIDC
jgi:trehalose/maltose hydrolase-like predicted phosphorylase